MLQEGMVSCTLNMEFARNQCNQRLIGENSWKMSYCVPGKP